MIFVPGVGSCKKPLVFVDDPSLDYLSPQNCLCLLCVLWLQSCLWFCVFVCVFDDPGSDLKKTMFL